ncbi:MAG: hypothetical protein OEZ16_05845 [Chromatiales bacterium]|nr:hypothetical protein [Chromatiales bacterium]
MKRKVTLTFLAASLTACGGNSLLPSQQQSFSVDSLPPGASVIIMDEAVGQTPITLTAHQVFPQNFDHSKQHLYGRVELHYPGCKPFITAISGQILSSGLNARLECRDEPSGVFAPSAEHAKSFAGEERQEKTLKQRLRQLKELHEEGLIDEHDYREKRRQLLEAL